VFVGQLTEPCGVGAEAVADGLRGVLGLGFDDGGPLAELDGLLVGAGDIAAAGDAPVEAWGVPDAVAVAERPVALVVVRALGLA
jgi:hypothetical protein